MPENLLSQEEIDALLKSKRTGLDELRRKKARLYDFNNPERFPKEAFKRLTILHETMARRFSMDLSGYLRDVVNFSISSVDQLTYQEALMSMPDRTCFNVFSSEKLNGKVILEINPHIIFALIERLLGSKPSKSAKKIEREFSTVEWVVINKIIKRIKDVFLSVWAPVIEIDLALTDQDANPAMIQVFPLKEIVFLVCMDVEISQIKGILSICYPLEVLEPVASLLLRRQTSTSDRRSAKEKWRANLLSSPCELKAVLDKVEFPLKDICSLSKGDVLMLDKLSTDPILLSIGNVDLFDAHLCHSPNGKIALQIGGIRE